MSWREGRPHTLPSWHHRLSRNGGQAKGALSGRDRAGLGASAYPAQPWWGRRLGAADADGPDPVTMDRAPRRARRWLVSRLDAARGAGDARQICREAEPRPAQQQAACPRFVCGLVVSVSSVSGTAASIKGAVLGSGRANGTWRALCPRVG